MNRGGEVVSANDDCIPHVPVSQARFLFVGIIAFIIAFSGLISNSMLLRFYCKVKLRLLPTFYLTALALLDLFICLCYILIMCGDAASIYWQSRLLAQLWHFYLVPVFTLSRICELSSSYVILFASLERYLASAYFWNKRAGTCFSKVVVTSERISRKFVIFAIFLSATLLRLCSVWEVRVIRAENCTHPLGTVGVIRTQLYDSQTFYIFDWYIIPTVQIFLPVTLLLIVNICIIRSLKMENLSRELRRAIARREISNRSSLNRSQRRPQQQDQDHSQVDTNTRLAPGQACVNGKKCLTPRNSRLASQLQLSVSVEVVPLFAFGEICKFRSVERKQKLKERLRMRQARAMMAALISSYLICNSLNVFLRILERSDDHELLTDSFGVATTLYTVTSDLVSFLVMFNSFMRISIYLCFNLEFRKAFIKYFLSVIRCRKADSYGNLESDSFSADGNTNTL